MRARPGAVCGIGEVEEDVAEQAARDRHLAQVPRGPDPLEVGDRG